ncbi:uncharacterized protein LOC119381128 [Rhipicephalus sanguineus]|uniref:uncharacterized protein LOC119381128 n=1 Tax=Rhipicephalus sanguineus TaxID=34632 RepID=UPI0018934862|nr:uncharacterized protein LOC119381128 [Rhipicephalus sanguineus]
MGSLIRGSLFFIAVALFTAMSAVRLPLCLPEHCPACDDCTSNVTTAKDCEVIPVAGAAGCLCCNKGSAVSTASAAGVEPPSAKKRPACDLLCRGEIDLDTCSCESSW